MSWKEEIIWILSIFVVLITILTSGCGIVKPIADAIFSVPTDDSDDDPIDSGKESLFRAIKGSNWLVTFSILGMAAGVFALMNGSKIGIPAIVASGASLFMALAVARFATWMAVCGFVGAVGAVGVSIIVKQRALKEIIGNVQDIKESASNGGNKAKLCKDIESVLLKQTKSTKKLVGKIKKKLVQKTEKKL